MMLLPFRRLSALGLVLLFLAACATGPAPPPQLLPRDQIVLASAISVDAAANTVVLPLFRGEAAGQTVWYIVTDSSDRADAARRGVVHAPLLAFAAPVAAASRPDGTLVFPAAPDFSPRRGVRAGAGGFPPAQASPGAVASAAYSPLVRTAPGGPVLNAPIVAVGDGPFDVAGHGNTADRVLAIDTAARQVTMLLSRGFVEGRAVVYISTEASDPMAAALERAVYAPAIADGNGATAIHVVVNGPGDAAGAGDGAAQGMDWLLRHGRIDAEATLANARGLGAVGSVLATFPTGSTASGYSPLWAVNMAVWARPGEAATLRHQAELFRLVRAGALTGPGGAAYGPAGFVVNCPVIAWLDGPP